MKQYMLPKHYVLQKYETMFKSNTRVGLISHFRDKLSDLYIYGLFNDATSSSDFIE